MSDELEEMYWEFDAARKGDGKYKGRSQSERDAFKMVVRSQERKINCDQVAWLLDIANRYIDKDKFPAVSQQREMKKYAMLYEIMDIANLKFADKKALYNATPYQARLDSLVTEQ